MRELFLANARIVQAALNDERVAAAWDRDSVLEGQRVGSLVGHVARGGVWVVGDYLAADAPDGPVDFESAAEYFAQVTASLSSGDHVAIRDRGAEIAAQGHQHVVVTLATKLDRLTVDVRAEPPGRLVTVFAGKVMRLDDYLGTRLLEQVVHLDDLARSLDIEPWANATGAEALVISCGAEIGRLRHGGPAMLRTLFRGQAGTLPVL